jgi:pectinesterase
MIHKQFFFLVISFCCINVYAQRITVAQDGTGNFTTVQAAFNSIPLQNKKPVSIFVRNGIYVEKLRLDSSKNFVTLTGEDPFKTILSFNDHTGKLSPRGDTINTYSSESFLLQASDFTARNITFRNDAGFNAGQAVAVQVAGDKIIFKNCRFVGNQDVLFAVSPSGREYFEQCYIEGTTDFIFGAATVWFEKCHIHSKKNSHVTAASTPREHAFGFVFNQCIFTADSTLKSVSLGRPWRPYASVTYINCYMDRHILPEGWNNWKNPENEKTARFSEYGSYGPGASASTRFAWTKQLTDDEVKRFTLKNVFGNWTPK